MDFKNNTKHRYKTIQGLRSFKNTLHKEVKKIMETFKNNLHIFNLSHGILPHTPIENVAKTIKLIRDFNETK